MPVPDDVIREWALDMLEDTYRHIENPTEYERAERELYERVIAGDRVATDEVRDQFVRIRAEIEADYRAERYAHESPRDYYE